MNTIEANTDRYFYLTYTAHYGDGTHRGCLAFVSHSPKMFALEAIEAEITRKFKETYDRDIGHVVIEPWIEFDNKVDYDDFVSEVDA